MKRPQDPTCGEMIALIESMQSDLYLNTNPCTEELELDIGGAG